MKQVDILIIGGGSAGMAAAAAAYEQGVRDILILERSDRLGGILCQCIHSGFGLHRYGQELTGPEYAKRHVEDIRRCGIAYKLNTFVLDLTGDRVVTAMNPEDGLFQVQAKAVVLAMGCRERSRGALMIPGTRPAGVITAGTAQRYLNLEGYLPGKHVVILGSGDIGLIMARQFVMEGIEVKEVVELLPFSGGLTRNISQCLNDFNIPLRLSSTVVEIRGRSRVSSVVVAKVDEHRKPIPGTEREVPCDTLVISAGLIPENELSREAGVRMSPSTKGAVVDDLLQTSVPGIFACGNVLHVHDMVDFVSAEGELAGRSAAQFAAGEVAESDFEAAVPVLEGDGVGGLTPQYVSRAPREGTVKLMFRPRRIYQNAVALAEADGVCVGKKQAMVLAPGEMCELELPHAAVREAASLSVRIEERQRGMSQ